MDCESVLGSLGDDEADAEDLCAARHRRDHLEACPTCRHLHEGLQRGREILRSLPAVDVSADFLQSLQLRIEALEKSRRARRRRIALAGRLGAVAAAAALALLLIPPGPGRLDLLPGWLESEGSRTGASPAGARLLQAVDAAGSSGALETGGGEAGMLFARVPQPALAGWYDLIAAVREGAVTYGRPAASGRLQPLLYAAPSWTFAAAPASFHFVSATARSAVPTSR